MIELNKIYNMDCLEGLKQIDDKSIDLVLTDIPYGVCSGRKCNMHQFQINKGVADVVDFDLHNLIETIVKKTKQTAYVFCGTEQVSEIRKIMADSGMTTRLCIWEKTSASPMNGQYMWLSNIECCVYGRFSKATFNEFCQGSVWRCHQGSSKIHPTQKPIELFKRLILASSNKGDVVLDTFSGSGTTAVACRQTGRNFIAFEKNVDFYNASIKRFNEDTMQQELF